MKTETGAGSISVWRPAGLPQVEAHRGVSVARLVPRHSHEEYQFCLVEEGEGDLTYRGRRHLTPPASLFVVHPGEIHSNSAFDRLGCTYRTLFVAPELLGRAAAELSAGDAGLPFFPAATFFERGLVRAFRRLHLALEGPASALERESLLQSFTAALVARHAERPPHTRPPRADRRGVTRARDYLAEHYDEQVSLSDLAAVAGLSPFHLTRLFSAEVGMPPHAFQTQLRVARARRLLHEGRAIAAVAAETGFADQSHLTRHFKRIVGVTPGRFRPASKNVQDPAPPPR